MKASSMAPTLAASIRPELAPAAAASSTLVGWSSSSSRRSSAAETLSSGVSVSGISSLANSSPPGAAMKEAATRYSMGMPSAA